MQLLLHHWCLHGYWGGKENPAPSNLPRKGRLPNAHLPVTAMLKFWLMIEVSLMISYYKD
jgi:hypothetical protein